MFINDDHIIISPVEVSEIQPYHKGDMREFPEKFWNDNNWRKRLKRTMNMLIERGYPCFHFDCHTPILFNKALFIDAMSRFDYETGIGYTMKSLYGNVIHSEDGLLLSVEKKTVFSHYTYRQLVERVKGATYLSFNDSGINAGLKKYLSTNFPEPSKYETGNVLDIYIEIMHYQRTRDYREGLAIFAKYFQKRNMSRLMSLNETPMLRNKMDMRFQMAMNNYEKL
jgi:hypothetical protein